MHFFLAQCKDIYVLYSSGKNSVCSWTLSSALLQVSKLSQQFVFQSSLKVEPGYSFPNTRCLIFLHFSFLCLCTACSASQWSFFPYSRGKVSLAHFNLDRIRNYSVRRSSRVSGCRTETPSPFRNCPLKHEFSEQEQIDLLSQMPGFLPHSFTMQLHPAFNHSFNVSLRYNTSVSS